MYIYIYIYYLVSMRYILIYASTILPIGNTEGIENAPKKRYNVLVDLERESKEDPIYCQQHLSSLEKPRGSLHLKSFRG